MPSVTIGTMGFNLVFTAKIPPRAQEVLKQRDQNAIGFELTPSWGSVPSLRCSDLRRMGIDVPGHWGQDDEIFPIVNDIAFYIVPSIPQGMAMSMSMRRVNLRTGKIEEAHLTDDPCQSYWSQSTPWIDGYVPSHQQGVRQFVPLRGETAMIADVSNAVGVTDDDPLKDALSAAFYAPIDLSKLQQNSGYRSLGALESFGLESMQSKSVTRSHHTRSAPEAVGMGAGAVMKQRHPENPTVKASDFTKLPLIRFTSRLVWEDQYNIWARAAGEQLLTASTLRALEQQQQDYERRLWARLGVNPVNTKVDSFPTVA